MIAKIVLAVVVIAITVPVLCWMGVPNRDIFFWTFFVMSGVAGFLACLPRR